MRKCFPSAIAILFLLACTLISNPAPGQEDVAEPNVRRVFVPIDEIETVIHRDKKGVMLSREEFAKLYQQATAARANQAKPPAPILVTGADYEAEFVDQQLVMTARLRLRQFADGWQMLTIPVRKFSVEQALMDGKPAQLSRAKQAGQMNLFSLGQGEKVLRLKLSAPVSAVGSDKVVAFGLLPSPATTLRVNVPAKKHLLMDQLAVPRPVDIDQPATYELAVGGRNHVQLRLTEIQNQQSSDALVFASSGYGLNVAPGEITWQVVTDLQLYGRALDQFEFSVPTELEISAVESTGLESWDLQDGDTAGQTAITLKFRQPISDARQITFRGVMAASAGQQWTVPGLRLKDATSHVGRLLVQHPYGTRLLQITADGARPSVNAKQTAQPGNIQAQFDLWQEDFELTFVTEMRQRELFADLSTILETNETGVDLETLVSLQCLNAPLFEVDLRLPADWTVLDVTLPDKNNNQQSVDWKLQPQAAGEHRILVPLPTPLQPGEDRQLKLRARRETSRDNADDYEFTIPEVLLPQANVFAGVYMILTTNDFEMIPADLSGLDPAALESTQPHLGYRYQDTSISGRMQLKRKPARIIARTVSFTRIDRDAVRTRFDVRLQIEGGGTRSAKIQLPTSAGTDLRFRITGYECSLPQLQTNSAAMGSMGFVPQNSARIVSQSASDPDDNDVRVWTLQFDRRVPGHAELKR